MLYEVITVMRIVENTQHIHQINDLLTPIEVFFPIGQIGDAVTAQSVVYLRIMYAIRSYYGFVNEMRPDSYRKEAADDAWAATASFLKQCFEGT